jgi:hypothetical protein
MPHHLTTGNDTVQRLARIEQLWRELQTTFRDQQKSTELEGRIRQEADLVRARDDPSKPES